MKVSELGEFGLIRALSDLVVPVDSAPQPLLGIGDDAAALQFGDSTVLATTDTLVQGVHFDSGCTWQELGWKAIAINLSDIAAMGGIPRYALISLSLPADAEVSHITQLYEGIAMSAAQFDVAVAGGNVTSATEVIITITVIGEAVDGVILTRSAGIPGDLIAVTGYIGSSAAGREMLSQHIQLDEETMSFLREAHLQPQPRISEGKLLIDQGVRAAIDISDGLLSDLAHLCTASEVEAKVNLNQIPIHPMVKAAFKEPLNFVLGGGEDYELLFTASEGVIDKVAKKASCPITVIGKLADGESGKVTLFDKRGKDLFLGQKGWDHFGLNE